VNTTNSVRRAIAQASTYLGISHADAELLPAKVIAAIVDPDASKHPAFPQLMAAAQDLSEHDRAAVLRFASLLAVLGRVPTAEELADEGSEQR
jgi:hypothetical protein